MPDKKKIAVLGGGIGALTTVFFLTEEPDWSDRYEITVYQQGWRLGGKGACGRNAAFGERIEEHGPHVWFGFYQTAFSVLNTCYEYCRQNNLMPDSPFQYCIPDAMRAKSDSSVMEFSGGSWSSWHITLPEHAGQPFDPPEGLVSLIVRSVEYLIGIRDQLHVKNAFQPKTVKAASVRARALDRAYRLTIQAVGARQAPGVRLPVQPQQFILERIRDLVHHLDHYLGDQNRMLNRALIWFAGKVILALLHSFSGFLDERFAIFEDLSQDVRRLFLLLDLGIANLRGIFEDRILTRGFDVINDQDYSDWLHSRGCRHPWSPVVQGLYDACFAFDKGETDSAGPNVKPATASMEAGTTLRGALLLFFGYNGAWSYKMQSGMGDTIFSPLYLTLQHRGVKLLFFHQITNLGVKASCIESIDLNVQATVSGEYSPLKNVKGLPCWPNEPFWEELAEGEELRRRNIDLESCWSGWTGTPLTLRRGQDFDDVVLGISIGMLPYICKELLAASKPWRDMIEKVRSVQTQSFQIWLTKTAEQLGWSVDVNCPGTAQERQFELLAGYLQPFDSWADMSQVLPTEARETDAVKSVQYIFGLLPDAQSIPPAWTTSDFPHNQLDRVKAGMFDFLHKSAGSFFPLAVQTGQSNSFDWNLLYDAANAQGEKRLDSQFWRANVEPSERYVLSLSGTGRYRLQPAGSGFTNLYLAGDWTDNGFNVGSVEAAALSGKLAAKGIAAG